MNILFKNINQHSCGETGNEGRGKVEDDVAEFEGPSTTIQVRKP